MAIVARAVCSNPRITLADDADGCSLRGVVHEFRIYDRALPVAAIERSFALGPDP